MRSPSLTALPRAFRGRFLSLLLCLLFVLSSFLVAVPGSALAEDTTTLKGNIAGAPYLIEKPANWNGTIVLYSHGYRSPGSDNPAVDAPDPASEALLLSLGFALAGSGYSTTGWAVEQALNDQIALLDFFTSMFGAPKRTIAWGHSMGGIITGALLQENPNRFDGAIPMCGVMGGSPPLFNGFLDVGFTFKTLLAGDNNALAFPVVTNAAANIAEGQKILAAAQATPEGRARLALAASIGEIPGWFDPATPAPAATDYLARETNQFLWFKFLQIGNLFGNGSVFSNVGVNYRQMFDNITQKDLVQALYAQAGLNLDNDLNTLNNATRTSGDPTTMAYLSKYYTFNGQIKVPVLTMHTTGDGYVVVQNENTYARLVNAAGNGALLNQTYVNRAGHCTFTPAEHMTAFLNLLDRLETGKWKNGQEADRLNSEAAALGPNFNVRVVDGKIVAVPSAFIAYAASRYPREFSTQAPAPRPLPNTGPENTPAMSFPETGFSLGGMLLSFWQNNGGLPVFGFPIDSERQNNGVVFQWLERNRVELHPENKAPYNVQLGLLGSEALARRGVDWKSLPTVNTAPEGCRYFEATGHSLCSDFLAYWQTHGLKFDSQPGQSYTESLALFGYPLTEPTMETNADGDTVLTQWFERARLEFHPNNPGQYRVQLGRLGAEVYATSH